MVIGKDILFCQSNNGIANSLQQQTQQLIAECKMTGKDHEVLHVWLEDFLTSIKQLKSSDAELQQQGFEKLTWS